MPHCVDMQCARSHLAIDKSLRYMLYFSKPWTHMQLRCTHVRMQMHMQSSGLRSQSPPLRYADTFDLTLQVRMVRKQVVKKALALMERIDNVRAGMLRSLLDASHPHDQAASKTPPQTPKRDQAQSTTPDAVQQTPTNQLHSAQESFMAAEAAAADTLTDGSLKAAQGLVADALTDNSTQQQGTSAPESDAAGAASNKYSNAQPEQMDSFKTGSGAKKAISGDVAESDTDGAAGNAASLAADTDADTDVFASLSDKEVIDGICSGVDAVMAGQTAVREGEDGSVQDLVGGAEEDV